MINPAKTPDNGTWLTQASRLCSQCGLCCNGVMFHTVRLQPGDSPRALAALGLKLKRKKRQDYIIQPCPAYRESRCSIYSSRPERCRLFACRQLRRVIAGEITESAALEKIRLVQARVQQVEDLLQLAGGTNPKRALSKRCEKAMAEPVDASSDFQTVEIRQRLLQSMKELEALLDQDFRIHSDAAGDSGNPPGLSPLSS